MQNRLEMPHEIQTQIWKELGRATHDRHHAWRTPVLATNAVDGSPNARTVVLRKASPPEVATTTNNNNDGGVLEIYTDGRSPKVDELRQQPRASLVFWSARLSWQLRVKVQVSIQTDGPEIELLWQTVRQTRSAGDYLSLQAPGQTLGASVDPLEPPQQETDVHFAVLRAKVVELDWLELGRGQHRRARMTVSQREPDWQWLQP